MKLFNVIAAIAIRNNKILCTQRPDKGEVALKWEFPGGKIEPGESHKEALKREIREELDCDISVDEFFMTVYHKYKTFDLTMHCYKCTLLNDKVVLNEHADSCWLPVEELDVLDWAPADWPIIKKLMLEGI